VTPEKELELIGIFPELFENPYQEGCSFYFECGDGWFALLKECIEKIKKETEGKNYKEIFATQVKEKYGSLRFYLNCGTDAIYSIIEEAEKKSEKTCERCGDAGENKRVNGWYATLCNKCCDKVASNNPLV
jgi:hypothetical protein